jgi:hypothetical protein
MSEHQLARAGLARDGQVGLPCDWREGGAPMTPARRLMAAVLEDAVHELTHPGGGSARARERRWDEVLAWFASDDDTWPFSFVNVCDALGIAPSRLRTQLRGS